MSSDHLLQRINEAKEQQSKKLDLSYEQLTQIPDAVFELTHLTELNLTGNHLKNLPESITKLAHLTQIDLSRNLLSNLPESIS